MYIPLRPSGVTVVNQSRPTLAARADPEAEVECGIHTSPPSRLPVFIYWNLFVKPGPHPRQSTKMSTLFIVLILGAINARRSFNEEKLVKQQAILTTKKSKKVRLHEEIRKTWYEEYSRFCWKIWRWGKI